MEGKTHMLTATALFFALCAVTKEPGMINMAYPWNTPDIALVSLGAVLTGSILPDMDMPGSTAGSKLSLINIKMVKLVVNVLLIILGVSVVIFFGNKYVLYVGCAILLFSLLTYKSLTNKLLYLLRRIVQILIIGSMILLYVVRHNVTFLLIAVILGCYIFSKHRGISHTLILSAISAFCIYDIFICVGLYKYSYYAAAYYFAGCFLHIYLNDYLTDKGVPNPLYPLTNIITLPWYLKKWGISKRALKDCFKIQRVKFLFTIETGSTGEVLFSIACVLILAISYVQNFMG